MNRILIGLLSFGCLLASWQGFAQSSEVVFQGMKLIEEREAADKHYMLPQGRVKLDRSVGRNIPTKYKRLQGDFSSVVWEITGGVPLEDAVQQVRTFLDNPRYEILFECKSRDCGDSFSWANSVFEQPVLYGSDRNQYLWSVKDAGARRYHCYYLVQRPNGRLYFYEEVLFVPELMLDANIIRERLQRAGRINLGELTVNKGKVDASVVIERIKPHLSQIEPELLVIHRHGLMMDLDIKSALESELKKAGLNKVRVEDVKNLVPQADAAGPAWVEWVNPAWIP